MDLPHLAQWGRIKGIQLLGTGDFTHPRWFYELRRSLRPAAGYGIYEYEGVSFLLTTEVNNIYVKGGQVRKVHNLLFAPSLEVVSRLNDSLSRYGNLEADGRPILNLDCEDLVKLVLDLSAECLIVPAHAWTPHFAVFGANSGFNSLQECFGSQTRYIYAIETGLSSDPPMNWRLSALDRVLLLSNSDAHSLKNLGREANCFDCALDYQTIAEVIKTKDASRFLGTIEFFPEEGKYHYDGHRNCQARIHPREAIAKGNLCPSCHQKVTIGVLHRVEELADRPLGYRPKCAMPFSHMILLEEIIADALGQGRGTVGVQKEYLALTGRLGSELDILLRIPEEELRHQAPGRVVEGILKARLGEVDVLPGYDGLYGEIKLRWGDVVVPQRQAQLDLFA